MKRVANLSVTISDLPKIHDEFTVPPTPHLLFVLGFQICFLKLVLFNNDGLAIIVRSTLVQQIFKYVADSTIVLTSHLQHQHDVECLRYSSRT